MKLSELEARFLKLTSSHDFRTVETIGEADGVCFLCPKCFKANGGAVGTHSIICWSPSVPNEQQPGPGRWSLNGAGIDDLTLTASSSSIALVGGCEAHFFVQAGAIVEA